MLDVTFPYVLNVDTAINVANEMMSSEIIEPEDVVVVASNIDDLVEKFRDNRKLMETPGKTLFLYFLRFCHESLFFRGVQSF